MKIILASKSGVRKKIMKDSGLDIIAADNLSDAARKIVSSVKENS